MVAPGSASGIPRPPQTATARLIAERDSWRRQLQAEYTDAHRRLQQAYTRSLVPIRARADALLAEYDRRYQAGGGQVDFEDVRGLLTRYDLLGRVEGELTAFANYNRANGDMISNAAFGQGVQAAGQLAATQLPGPARDILTAAWIEPDPGALRNLAAYIDGAAYTAAWDKFGQNAARNLGDTLLTMMAQGKSPIETARYMSAWYGVPMAWAANSARTLQLYSYRAGQQFTYQQNADVLDGWMWSCSRDVRVCVSCWAQDGRQFALSDSLNDHHQGRCAMLPVVKGARWPTEYGTGEQFFNAQDKAFQRETMGDTLFEAWKAGKVQWADFGGRTYDNAILGEMRRAPTLSELGLRRVIAVKPATAQAAEHGQALDTEGGAR